MSAPEPRAKVEKKTIRVTNYLFVYAAPTPSGFAENSITVRPGDTAEDLDRAWGFVNGQTGAKVCVYKDKVLWFEQQERDIEVLVTD